MSRKRKKFLQAAVVILAALFLIRVIYVNVQFRKQYQRITVSVGETFEDQGLLVTVTGFERKKSENGDYEVTADVIYENPTDEELSTESFVFLCRTENYGYVQFRRTLDEEDFTSGKLIVPPHGTSGITLGYRFQKSMFNPGDYELWMKQPLYLAFIQTETLKKVYLE